jgi:HEAT repeat protein
MRKGQVQGRTRRSVGTAIRGESQLAAEELYDLSNDPDQKHNAASDKQYFEIVEMLGKQLDKELIDPEQGSANDGPHCVKHGNCNRHRP